MAGRTAGAGEPLPFTGTPGAHYQVGPPRDWGSGCCGSFGERVVRGEEALPEAGAERAIVDGAADLEQPIGTVPRPAPSPRKAWHTRYRPVP